MPEAGTHLAEPDLVIVRAPAGTGTAPVDSTAVAALDGARSAADERGYRRSVGRFARYEQDRTTRIAPELLFLTLHPTAGRPRAIEAVCRDRGGRHLRGQRRDRRDWLAL